LNKGAKQPKKEGSTWPSGQERTLFSAVLCTSIKEYVLGKRYDLSVAFLPPKEMREVTLRTKKKDKASNVLSFPLSKTSGEILICKATARTQAKSYGMTPEVFVYYLFIHGLLHLKGFKHGATMEHEERRVMRRFSLRVDEQSSNRN
jgi:probable rRNA maturation factor